MVCLDYDSHQIRFGAKSCKENRALGHSLPHKFCFSTQRFIDVSISLYKCVLVHRHNASLVKLFQVLPSLNRVQWGSCGIIILVLIKQEVEFRQTRRDVVTASRIVLTPTFIDLGASRLQRETIVKTPAIRISPNSKDQKESKHLIRV